MVITGALAVTVSGLALKNFTKHKINGCMFIGILVENIKIMKYLTFYYIEKKRQNVKKNKKKTIISSIHMLRKIRFDKIY